MSGDQTMHKPSFKNELNLNTLLLFVGIISLGVAWGIAYNKLDDGTAMNRASIAKLEARVLSLENVGRTLDNHELRITNVEVSSKDASAAMRAVESSIHELASDTRLMREILERLDRGQRSAAPR